MSAKETFQIPLETAEVYESKFVPALFADWAPHVVDMGDVTAGHNDVLHTFATPDGRAEIPIEGHLVAAQPH